MKKNLNISLNVNCNLSAKPVTDKLSLSGNIINLNAGKKKFQVSTLKPYFTSGDPIFFNISGNTTSNLSEDLKYTYLFIKDISKYPLKKRAVTEKAQKLLPNAHLCYESDIYIFAQKAKDIKAIICYDLSEFYFDYGALLYLCRKFDIRMITCVEGADSFNEDDRVQFCDINEIFRKERMKHEKNRKTSNNIIIS